MRRTLWAFLSVLLASAALAQQADDGEWRGAGRDPGLNRFSGLAQITTANAAQLKLARAIPLLPIPILSALAAASGGAWVGKRRHELISEPVQNWIYASVLALEALAIAAVGVGTHTRALILLGTGFFGLAAIRGALLAFSSGVPVALIIAALALVLMGSATWLSLRVRQDASVPHTS